MNKELLVKTLKFLKEEPDIRELTIDEIEKRFYHFEHLLISLVEDSLQDKENEHGTMTSWWLYDSSEKIIYDEDSLVLVKANVESAEDFVNYMINTSRHED